MYSRLPVMNINKESRPAVNGTALLFFARMHLTGLSRQVFLDLVFVHDRFFERVSAGFGAAYRLDHFAPVLCLGRCLLVLGLDRRFSCFCHGYLISL